MPARRILSLWFARLPAERLLRQGVVVPGVPFAVTQEGARGLMLCALSPEAEAAGLHPGQPLADARAICPALVTRPAAPQAEAAFLEALARWAGRYSPWVAPAPPDGLTADVTGCAHLFGGEAELLAQMTAECTDLGLSVSAALADTPAAAWALARHGHSPAQGALTGDAIAQEARATRSRAARRPVAVVPPPLCCTRIVPPGQGPGALAPLPVAALRLPPETVAALDRLGLRRIGDLSGQPRAALARRFGQELLLRLDQALGRVPEPVSPRRASPRLAVRLTLPEPIGRQEDIAAALDRLLPALAARLQAAGLGARRVRLDMQRSDHQSQSLAIGLAQATAAPDRIKPLLMLKLDRIEAGPGIETLRLSAPLAEPIHPVQHRGQMAVSGQVLSGAARGDALADLIGRMGARVGLEAITRLHPGDSHIPEKTTLLRPAAWAPAAQDWPARLPTGPRPLRLMPPEPVQVDRPPQVPVGPPAWLRWRRQRLEVAAATGPERIAPEWWLDEPEWRSGLRDYWRIETTTGLRLWLFYAHGGALSGGWFCQGIFA